MSQTKKWGEEDFWGLGFEWDPQWVLTDKQKELLREFERLTMEGGAKHNPQSKSWMEKVKEFFE